MTSQGDLKPIIIEVIKQACPKLVIEITKINNKLNEKVKANQNVKAIKFLLGHDTPNPNPQPQLNFTYVCEDWGEETDIHIKDFLITNQDSSYDLDNTYTKLLVYNSGNISSNEDEICENIAVKCIDEVNKLCGTADNSNVQQPAHSDLRTTNFGSSSRSSRSSGISYSSFGNNNNTQPAFEVIRSRITFEFNVNDINIDMDEYTVEIIDGSKIKITTSNYNNTKGEFTEQTDTKKKDDLLKYIKTNAQGKKFEDLQSLTFDKTGQKIKAICKNRGGYYNNNLKNNIETAIKGFIEGKGFVELKMQDNPDIGRIDSKMVKKTEIKNSVITIERVTINDNTYSDVCSKVPENQQENRQIEQPEFDLILNQASLKQIQKRIDSKITNCNSKLDEVPEDEELVRFRGGKPNNDFFKEIFKNAKVEKIEFQDKKIKITFSMDCKTYVAVLTRLVVCVIRNFILNKL